MQHILMLPCSFCACIAACLLGRKELVDVVSMVEVLTIQWIGAGADLRVIRGVSQVYKYHGLIAPLSAGVPL